MCLLQQSHVSVAAVVAVTLVRARRLGGGGAV